MPELEQKSVAQQAPKAPDTAPARPPAATKAAGQAAVSRMIAANAGKLEGQLIASNNPEAVYSAGMLVSGLQVKAGKVGIYLHHGNHTSSEMDFFAVVHPSGSGAMTVTDSGSSAAGRVTGDRAHDPNYETARSALGSGKAQTNKGKGEQTISLGTCAASTNLHSADVSPLIDGRFDIDVDEDATIDIVCRKKGDTTSLDQMPFATGNSKMVTSDTGGRASGLYTGASYTDAPPPIEMGPGSEPFEYQIAAVEGMKDKAAAPVASQQKAAKVLTAEQLAVILGSEPTADAAVVKMVGEAYYVSETWLVDAGIYKDGKIVEDAATFGKDPSYKHMILDLLAKAKEDLASVPPNTRPVQAKACAKQISDNKEIGAKQDLANYGTIYDLTFTLLNSGHASSAQVSLDNRTGPYRGAAELNGKEADLFRDSGTKGGAVGVSPIGTVALPAASTKGPSSTTARVRLMSPGQISSGQLIKISPHG